MDNQSLKGRLEGGASGPVVLDVWENEPEIDVSLLNEVAIGTPHIAGYSLDGKVNGTIMLYRQLCRFLKTDDNIQIEQLIPTVPVPQIILDTSTATDQNLLSQAENLLVFQE